MNEVDLIDIVNQLIAQNKRLLKRNDILTERVNKFLSDRAGVEEKLKWALQTIFERYVEQPESRVQDKFILYMNEWDKIQERTIEKEIPLDFHKGRKAENLINETKMMNIISLRAMNDELLEKNDILTERVNRLLLEKASLEKLLEQAMETVLKIKRRKKK